MATKSANHNHYLMSSRVYDKELMYAIFKLNRYRCLRYHTNEVHGQTDKAILKSPIFNP